MSSDLDNIYKYHSPKGDQAVRYETIRECAKVFAELIKDVCPDSRERSIAFINLENAVMWSNASIARNEI